MVGVVVFNCSPLVQGKLINLVRLLVLCPLGYGHVPWTHQIRTLYLQASMTDS